MRLWRTKWGFLRLAIAAFLLYAVASDTGARLARMELASLPGFNYLAEIDFLRESGRYGEALVIADAGLDATDGPARDAIQQARETVAAEQSSTLRRLKDAGMGALSGRGTSIESLIGAVAADFFIVGDIRDLVIQGGRYVLDGETDEVILILSGVGLATTIAPEVDWVPAVLKAAKKAGAMSKGMAEWIVAAAKSGNTDALNAMFKDIKRLAAKASPGGAARMLKHADTPEEVARLARFVETHKAGAFALHITGKEGADLAKAADLTADTGRALVTAASKGASGTAWLRTGAYRALARPHWLAGLGKALWKGNAEDLAARIAAAIDPRAWWLVPLLAAWTLVEAGWLLRRLTANTHFDASRRVTPAPAT